MLLRASSKSMPVVSASICAISGMQAVLPSSGGNSSTVKNGSGCCTAEDAAEDAGGSTAEEAVLPETTKRLTEKMHTMIRAEQVDPESRILYVDDGSRDKTWAIISEYAEAIPYVDGVKLAHNRGHQNALLAGLMTAMPLCDCAISMDADLQDDINVIDRFVEKYMEGCDVVYGVRNKRETDTFFKRTTAEGFYKFMKILGVDVVFNHADYRLMSRRALEGLSEYKEVNLFLRGGSSGGNRHG